MICKVFETYEDFEFTVKFISNGYLITYKDHGTFKKKEASFGTFDEVISFVKTYYRGEWE